MAKATKNKEIYVIEKQYNNHLLSLFLLNNLQANLSKIEKHFNITIYNKGENYKFKGNLKKQILLAIELFNTLTNYLTSADKLHNNVLEDMLNPATNIANNTADNTTNIIKTKRKNIILKNISQINYAKAIDNNKVIFATGPAGGGKTYLAIAKAIEYFLLGKISKIIVSRPIVEVGSSLGYLPGDINEKVDPYLTPIKDAMLDMLPNQFLLEMIEQGQFEVAPMAFMRGRTFNNSFIVLDEAQNATLPQLKMLLTRIGEHSKIIINGDLTQIDLTYKLPSGLQKCIDVVTNINEITHVEFKQSDIVRSLLVQQIVNEFSKHNL